MLSEVSGAQQILDWRVEVGGEKMNILLDLLQA